MKQIQVLVCDDSAIVRDLVSRELARFQDIAVAATAPDPYVARDKLSRIKVDVVLLDIEMPRMDGLTFLKQLMKHYPLPVIILSSLVSGNNTASLEALELGAVDVIPKPGGPFSVKEVIPRLASAIRAAAAVDFEKVKAQAALLTASAKGNPKTILTKVATTNRIIAVGASTGGPQAMEALFRAYDRVLPPTLAVIHMPERFTLSYAQRLDTLCSATVKEAEDGDIAIPGCIYLAPGNNHMTVKLEGARYRIILHKSPKLHGQRPAVDILFRSVADQIGSNATGILMTGMGRDGAEGLLAMKRQGAWTICQDEASSIVWGMPRAGIECGAACETSGLDSMYGALLRSCHLG